MINTEELREYSRKAILISWDGEVPEAAVQSTRQIFREFIDALLALGADPPLDAVESAFVTCIQRLNDLDMEDQFICTIEREDICEELYAIGDICGAGDSVDDWLGERDW